MMELNFNHFGFFETPTILQKLQVLSHGHWKTCDFLNDNSDNYLKANIIPVIGDYWSKKDSEYLKNYYNVFEKEIVLLNNFFIHKFKSGTFSRCVVVKLRSGSVITSHLDHESAELDSRRFIIPIISYPDIYYQVDSEEKSIPANEMWEINISKNFAVKNYCHTDSIHITVDWKLEK